MRRIGLNGLIFHDGLSDAFLARYQRERIRFQYVDPTSIRFSLCDQQYFFYLDYLKAHEEIARVFMTDVSDVTVMQNPFPLLTLGFVYAGSQPGFIHVPNQPGWGGESYQYIQDLLLVAGARYLDFINRLDGTNQQVSPQPAGRFGTLAGFPVLNTGILGGYRRVVLKVLEKMVMTLQEIDKGDENLNMGVFNYVLYKYFRDQTVTGAPIHSNFGRYETHRQDIWFVHK